MNKQPAQKRATIQRSIVVNADPSSVWAEVNKPRLLFEVARPLVRFVPLSSLSMDSAWEGGPHRVRMLLFGFVPVGEQVINIERPVAADGTRLLRDNGSSDLIEEPPMGEPATPIGPRSRPAG